MKMSDEPSSAVVPFMPRFDIREVHRIAIEAPAETVLQTACDLEIETIPLVRLLFTLRSVLLGSRPAPAKKQGLLAEMLGIGWTLLARTDRDVVMGATTEPWVAKPRFAAVDPERFAGFDEPGHVKIVWSLEAIPRTPAACVFRTETRAVATDAASRRRFRGYWLAFGCGTALIRIAILRRLKHVAESRAAVRRSIIADAWSYAIRVYAFGFAFGTVRELFVVRRLGRTRATAVEAPFMAVASWFVARHVVRNAGVPYSARRRLAIGAAALALTLPIELAGVGMRRMSPAAFLQSQRSAAGAIFAGLLVCFAAAPLLAAARRTDATLDERHAELPGDAFIAQPLASLTNGVTIRAARAAVWPWLVQMGAGRGGWYSYDLLDNGGRPSASSVVPAWQHIASGDVLPARAGATDAFPVLAVQPEEALVLGYAPAGETAPLFTWTFVLHDAGEATRLITRARVAAGYRLFGMAPAIGRLIMGAIHGVMQTKQLQNIADRAERGSDGR